MNEWYEISLEETLEETYDLICLMHKDEFLNQIESNFEIDDEKEAKRIFTEFEKSHPDICISYRDGLLYMGKIK